MTVRARELVGSRTHSVDPKNPRIELEYAAWGSTDDAEIRAAMQAGTPAGEGHPAFPGLPPVYAGLSLLGYDPKPAGGGLWFVTARYGLREGAPAPAVGGAPNPPGAPSSPPPTPAEGEPLGPEWSFTTTGGTQRLYQSLETRSKDRAGVLLPADYKRAIGVTKDGVEGVDVVAPKFEFTYTAKFAALSAGYLKILGRMSGEVNAAGFMGWAEEEVLYLGATGAFRQGDVAQGGGWTVTFNFAAGKNRTNVAVSPDITLPEVRAWDYVWVSYEEGESNGVKTRTAIAAYAERVYPKGDFSTLGIGGGG
jgi:hypothetical protein